MRELFIVANILRDLELEMRNMNYYFTCLQVMIFLTVHAFEYIYNTIAL